MRLAGERGVTIIEMLVAITISAILLTAVLTTFNVFNNAEHDNATRSDTTELARNALDVETRQLRNLAKRVSSPVIDTLSSYDLIFQTSDPERTWVRYCLNTTSAPGSTDRGRLWTGELTVASASLVTPVSASMRTGCPGTGWTTTRLVADYVTNRRAGQDRPLFSYTCIPGTSCTSSPSTYDQVIGISAQLLIDTTPTSGTPELRLASGVYLRNQNQVPVAAFVWSRASATRTVVLNAGGSTDYEGRALDYYWFKDTMPAEAGIDCAHPSISGYVGTRTLWGSAGYLGNGVTFTYAFPSTDGNAGTSHNVGLVVCDPGDRYDTAGMPPEATIAVQIPT
jgi:prepilin-type N-terminal cleavage/methylation domain-containing protein